MLSENGVSLVHTTNTTATTTFTAQFIEAPNDAQAAVVLYATVTGGDGTTKVKLYLDHSIDGTVWFPALPGEASTSTPASVNQLIHTGRYVRGRTVITGTAPSAVAWDMVLLVDGPATFTALS